MYYLLRANDEEAFCAIVIPETNGNERKVVLYARRRYTAVTRGYDIRQQDPVNPTFYKDIGTVTIDWEDEKKIPHWPNRENQRIGKSLIWLEPLSKAQFETYALLGLPYVTREDQNPFNILSTIDL